MRVTHILLLLFFSTLLPALVTAAAGQTNGSAEHGAEMVARWCTDCHATGAARRAADVAPTFPSIAGSRSPDYLRGFLANPHVRGLMPPFELGTQEIEDIVAYLQTLK